MNLEENKHEIHCEVLVKDNIGDLESVNLALHQLNKSTHITNFFLVFMMLWIWRLRIVLVLIFGETF